jgi:hypothetical protein
MKKEFLKKLEDKKPASISLNGPDGILPQVQATAVKISKKFGIPAYVLADTTWGTCDLNSLGSKVLGAGIPIQYWTYNKHGITRKKSNSN